MSNSASISAAKRRRGVQPPNLSLKNSDSSKICNRVSQKELKPQKSYTVNGLLMDHDYRIFTIEGKMENYKSLLQKNSENELDNESSIGNLESNKIMNLVSNHSNEIEILKRKTDILEKHLKTANSLITMMKASMLSQGDDIKGLKKLYDEQSNQSVPNLGDLKLDENSSENEEEEESDGSHTDGK